MHLSRPSDWTRSGQGRTESNHHYTTVKMSNNQEGSSCIPWDDRLLQTVYSELCTDTVAVPLVELMKEGRPESVEWNDTTGLAFQTLKAELTSSTLLKNPNLDPTFILQTDASNIGVGVVLSQRDSPGNDYPIAYLIRSCWTWNRSTP